MEAQQTFIIEASRQNSVEVNSKTASTNFSSWTNRIEPTLLKKGDYVSVNTAIVNQKGASGANNIEFSDEYNNPTDNLQQNFTLITAGFYVCNNNVNSCPLPFKYLRRLADHTDPARKTDGTGRVRIQYETASYKEVSTGHYSINGEFGMGEYHQPFTTDFTPNSYTCDAISSFQCKNPHIKIDGRRYAKVGNRYVGWQRPYEGKNDTLANLLLQDIPLHIERGFKDASSVGDTLTSILQSTNEPYSKTGDIGIAESTLYTEVPNEVSQTQINPRFNGYCMKTIGANLQPVDSSISTTEGEKGGPLYNNLCVDEPFKWKYGTQLLSNSETHGFKKSPLLNSNYTSELDYVSYDYPILVWSTYNSSSFDDTSLNNASNYVEYCPHFSTQDDTGGDDVMEFKGFSTTMTGYNDVYAQIYDVEEADSEYKYGSLFFKSGTSTYFMFNPQSANQTPSDSDGRMIFLSFLDNDAVDFSRIIGYSPKMDLGGDDWVVKGENVARAVPTEDFFTEYTFPAGDNLFYTRLVPYEERAWVVQGTSGGSNGKKYIQSLGESGFQIVSGRKYRYSFNTKYVSGTGSSSSYEHAIGIEDKTASFGMAGTSVTADGSYSQEFTATANASGTDIIEFFYDHAAPYNMVVEVTDFVLMDYSLEQGDIYEVEDIFWETETNNTSNKLYSLQITSNQLRNEKINLNNSYLADFNTQYTAYSQLKAYTAGGTIVAFDGANPNDYDDAVIFLYQGNAGYDLVIYNQFTSKKWVAAKITKFTGNTIESGTVLGTYSDLYTLKDPFRSGQQYYNFSAANNYTDGSSIVKYDLASGNGGTGWKDYPPPTLEYYNFTDVVGTSTSGFDYDHTYQRTTPASSNIVYLKTTAGTSGLQGTARFDGGTASAIWNGTWTLTTSGGVDGYGELTLNGTVVSTGATFTAVFVAQATLTLASGAYAFTNHIADPLPVIDTDKEYFQSIVHDGTTYYLGANSNGAGDDTDKEGKRGRLIYSTDGGATYTTATWNWDGAYLIDMNGVGGNIALTTTGTIVNTDIITYTTRQDVLVGGTTYAFPVDGKQYGVSNEAGTTTKTTDLHNPLPVSSTTIDKVYLGLDDPTSYASHKYYQGSVYESLTETTQSNRICQWYNQVNSDNTVDVVFHETGNTNEILLIIENSLSSTILEVGWRLFKSSVFDYVADDKGQTLTIQDNENYKFTGSITDAGDAPEGGKTIPNEQTYGINGDSGTLSFSEDGALNTTHADLPKHTMLMTNIKYTLDNIKMVENYFRYTEIYNGVVESSRKKISEDIENFYTTFDIGRTDDNNFLIDAEQKPYYANPYANTNGVPLTKFTDMNYGMMGVDDSDHDVFTDWNGTTRKGTNKNDGNINPRTKGNNGEEQRIKVFTRYKSEYIDRLIFTNRLENYFTEGNWATNGKVYGKYIDEEDFQKDYEDLYNYVTTNNVGVFPYLARDFNNVNSDGTYNYILCMAFETYEDVGRTNQALLKQQHGTYFCFSPSFFDHNYITTLNTDTPYVNPTDTSAFGAGPQMIKDRNMNFINIGAAPTISYSAEANRFQWQYLHTPFYFNEITGSDSNLGEEVAFLNSDTLMIMGQGIGENNLESGGDSTADPPVKPQQIHMGVADAQCGIFIADIYGQTPRETQITDRTDGVRITQDNYDNTLFWTLGFSYYDLKPIRFTEDSFNNRFNRNTYNTITTDFKRLGTSPFTTNSAISIADQQKTNIFSGANYKRVYDTSNPFNEQQQATTFKSEGTPQYYLGYNNLQAVSIKTNSALMTSRSVIVNLTAPFYRIYCNIPLDTLSYLTDGSLSCAGYMTKNYQSQSFIYSFASDYGGFLTRDMILKASKPMLFIHSRMTRKARIFFDILSVEL